MPVQNFLEDEDYEDADESQDQSSVPDFLSDEQYDDTTADGYYGGGFSEGVGGPGSAGIAGEVFGGYEDDEDELFEGGIGLEDGADETSEETSSYGISGLPSRLVAPVRAGARGTDDVEDTAVAEGEAVAQSSVPNFLQDEDEDEAPLRTAVATPFRAPAPESNRVPEALPGALPTDGANGSTTANPSSAERSTEPKATVALTSNAQATRPRRDLSKRSQQDGSVPRNFPGATKSSPSPDTTPVVPSANTSGSSAPKIARDTVAVSFDPKAEDDPISEDEARELKAPSNYAANRELKFTALRQKEATVRKVGGDGLTPAERARSSKAAALATIRTPSNGKLSQEELLFYANLGAQRSADFGSVPKKKLFLPPMLAEDASQKKERELRINRALAGGSVVRGAKTRLTEKDYRVLQFIAIFKFASERQIAKLLQIAEITAYKRLNGLRKHGLTKGFKTLGVKGSVWVLTETGMDLSGYELPRGTESALTLSMVSHQFTVNHVAAHLWAGGANVLREKNFPQRNLPDGAGGFGFGERLISELQIQSAFGKVRGTTKADAYVPQIKKRMANQFDDWQRAGGANGGPSPELKQGNEFMWTLFPPISNRLNYHVPDLVVARQRSADGKPQSIAVEVELRTKADDSSYERTLDAYRADDRIFKKVVWICRLKGTAEKLSKIAKRNGLADQGRIAIVPIYLEDGSRFTGRDTWSL